jgi:hypothetical protein
MISNTTDSTTPLNSALWVAGGINSEKRIQCAELKVDAGAAITQFDNDGAMAANSSTRSVTQSAVRSYVGSVLGSVPLTTSYIGYGVAGVLSGSANFTITPGALTTLTLKGASGNKLLKTEITNGSTVMTTDNSSWQFFVDGSAFMSADISYISMTRAAIVTAVGAPQLSVRNGTQTLYTNISNTDATLDLLVAGPLNMTANITQLSIASANDSVTPASAALYCLGGGTFVKRVQCAELKVDAGAAITQFDNDGAMTANSSTRSVTQSAVRSYVGTSIANIAFVQQRIPFCASPSGILTSSGNLIFDNGVSTTGICTIQTSNGAVFAQLTADSVNNVARVDGFATTFQERLGGIAKLSHTSADTTLTNKVTITNVATPQLTITNSPQSLQVSVTGVGTSVNQAVANPMVINPNVTIFALQSTVDTTNSGTSGSINTLGGAAVNRSLYVGENVYTPWKTLSLVGAGPFNDQAIVDGFLFKIPAGFTNNAQLTGVAGGVNGRHIKLIVNTYGSASATLVVVDDSALSLAANRILTPSSSNVNLAGNPIAACDLTYDATISRWIMWNLEV